jgi:hypothetical protein
MSDVRRFATDSDEAAPVSAAAIRYDKRRISLFSGQISLNIGKVAWLLDLALSVVE